MGGSYMGAAGNKKPKKQKSGKHEKHIPAYQADTAKIACDDLKVKK
ncbi:MAG: hypothetical protein KBH23_01055 [Bacteroidaceae bacterium]|nr:hypothetical protein [Bacteroidaceae bacterium]MBP9636863.1 hypothetical protein [Bacteroidaceae bacterium]